MIKVKRMTYGIHVGKRRHRRSTGLLFRYKKNAKRKAHKIARRKSHGFNPRIFRHKKRQ